MHWQGQQYSYVEWQFNFWVYDPIIQKMYLEPNIYESVTPVKSLPR
jgi:hypothetical protein